MSKSKQTLCVSFVMSRKFPEIMPIIQWMRKRSGFLELTLLPGCVNLAKRALGLNIQARYGYRWKFVIQITFRNHSDHTRSHVKILCFDLKPGELHEKLYTKKLKCSTVCFVGSVICITSTSLDFENCVQ
jgi:hypothetical protein